ncbi:D-ribose pyranase [Virgibacillus pantothenticus]|uniref:D-ribose pyranase n=1 Tax=Virgibacillus pantothenticus TaxID=1473 RepID=UPI0009864591|nr:D-ribose pyranase [Virgibacillus pantothenticus]
MKKTGILNRDIASVLSQLGHTDTIILADCGLPIPQQTLCIDLSIELGTPSLNDILQLIMQHMVVEKITMAKEITFKNTKLHHQLTANYLNVETDYVSHKELKEAIKDAKAVIRTGEATPFANVILQAGVIF